jgi:rfaE bifunctional protein nucleotidyltransferase chain/domain
MNQPTQDFSREDSFDPLLADEGKTNLVSRRGPASSRHVIVYTTGVFDLLHPGHLNLLKRARALGDRLVVGVQEDDSAEAQKGKRPIMSCEQRMAMLETLPFVDIVLPYSDLDQRQVLELIKPDVMVQGGDWLSTGDRGAIIQYLQDNNIKLIRFPYTKDISSTDIKKRVYADFTRRKSDMALDFDLGQRLKLVPISNLLVYEDFDLKRTEKLVKSIVENQTFFNPLTAGDIGERNKYLVIDGANRLEAMRRLGAKYVFIQIVDYLNSGEVELRANEHYLDCSPAEFERLLESASIQLEPADGVSLSSADKRNDCLLALVSADNKISSLAFEGSSLNLAARADRLNKFVSSYKATFDIYRKSETGDMSAKFPVAIRFKSLSPADIVEIAHRQLHLESGITWHVVNNSVIRFKVPFLMLRDGFASQNEADEYLNSLIRKKISSSSIRRYVSNIYICDEWE